MKHVATLVLLCALAAAPAAAYVKPGPVMYGMEQGPAPGIGEVHNPPPPDLDPRSYRYPRHHTHDGPSQPLPEPGTMAMASIGLMALGATLRRRRGR